LKIHIDPGPVRALWRSILNLFNTTRDAVVQSVSVVLGRLRPSSGIGAALRGQEQGLVGLGSTVVGMATNAYEPLLERYRGETVIVQVAAAGKADPPRPPHEFAGHLISYTDKFLCIMAASGSAAPRAATLVSASRAAGPVAADGLRIERNDGTARIVATGSDAVILREIIAADHSVPSAAAVLVAEAHFEVPNTGDGPLEVRYELTRALDLVAPRSRAQVRNAATTGEG
jgi:hypothetical protein